MNKKESELINNELPKFMKELENGKYEVKGRHNVYVLEEKTAKVINLCKKLAENSNDKHTFEDFLLLRSIVSPEIDETTFINELKGSDYFKLSGAINYVYGLNDFL